MNGRDLAKAVGLSHSRFCYLFSLAIGVSPDQYFKGVRREKST